MRTVEDRNGRDVRETIEKLAQQIAEADGSSLYDAGREESKAPIRAKALRLLDVAKAAGPETRAALTLRLTIYAEMLEASESGFDNMSETGILRALVAQTGKDLEE